MPNLDLFNAMTLSNPLPGETRSWELPSSKPNLPTHLQGNLSSVDPKASFTGVNPQGQAQTYTQKELLNIYNAPKPKKSLLTEASDLFKKEEKKIHNVYDDAVDIGKTIEKDIKIIADDIEAFGVSVEHEAVKVFNEAENVSIKLYNLTRSSVIFVENNYKMILTGTAVYLGSRFYNEIKATKLI